MTQKYIVLFLTLLAFTVAKVSIADLSYNFAPSSEQDYANFINLFLGHHQESSALSPALAKMVADKRPSLMNAVNQVVFLLVPRSKQNTVKQNKMLNMGGKILQRAIFKAPQKFMVKMLSHHNEQEIKSYQNKDALVNIIVGQKRQLELLAKALSYQEYEKSQFQMGRRLQQLQVGPNDSTYLIKFFFSLMFVFVIIGIISFIAGNEGKKDTLLYAKFIADVGNSR